MIKFLLYCFLIINNLDKYFEDEGRVFKTTKRSLYVGTIVLKNGH